MSIAARRTEFPRSIEPKSRHQWGIVSAIVAVACGIGNAIARSRQRQVERELAQYLARSGGRLTDDIERQITRHQMSSNFNLRR